MISIRPCVDQLGQPVEIFGMMDASHSISEPLVCSEIFSDWIAAENVQKRAVAVVVGLLEDLIEIADGLMIVQGEDETDWIGHDVDGCIGDGRIELCSRADATAANGIIP